MKKRKNTNYKKGYAFERQLVETFKKAGWIAFRSAGSHSPIDVVGINPKTMEVKLVQCKNKVLTNGAVNKEIEYIQESGLHTQYMTAVRVMLAYKEKGHRGFKLKPI